VVWHVGTSGRGPRQAHHTISFGAAWRETFRELIDRGRLMSDPSLLVTNPTFTDPALAPDGRQTFYVLAPCPNLEVGRIDWARVGPHYVDEIRRVLADRGFDVDGAFSSGVETERLVTPADWARDGLAAGTPFALAHSVRQTGPLRHPTRHPSVPNLLFCGAGAQPGIGVPTVLLSGRLAAERITSA
jgi:phytoene desaturase